jgi:hypothetical protein
MTKGKKTKIEVQGRLITIQDTEFGEFICLSDMVKNFAGGSALIEQWLKNKDTILFLGVWEKIHNSDFNSLEFEGIKNESGRNSFYISAKTWINKTKAIGLYAHAGRYGATYAHQDIAFEFGSWLSPEFKLYLIKEFRRLKEEEAARLASPWNLNRTLSKINYKIHTDAIKTKIIPVTEKQASTVYATEADLLNVAVFSCTAKDWRKSNPKADGNIRDSATLEQLLVLSNLESINAELIHLGLSQRDRLIKLNETAIRQIRILSDGSAIKFIKDRSDK